MVYIKSDTLKFVLREEADPIAPTMSQSQKKWENSSRSASRSSSQLGSVLVEDFDPTASTTLWNAMRNISV